MPDFPDPATRNVLVPDCRECPALVESRNCISWGQGDTDADLVVVGEAPGAGDADAETWRGGNHTGMAYTTRHSGRRVRELVADLGFPDAYFTNAVKCHPPQNRDPTETERENCSLRLETELAEIQPHAVLATGSHATASLLEMADRSLDRFVDSVADCVREGRPLDWPGVDAALVPALHPSYENVWLARLDLTREAYVAGLRDALASARR
ncbi:uracil-DNA glycosylase [Halobacterium wangiae]|uniref:uracil-DNA glycosylase n=1 Tax=Halobacterium wangiae TaxID=2902623 RepID=UPI001E4B46E6|nr:uracil-DNA glycosylase family protein [Halobacterium wangiae]